MAAPYISEIRIMSFTFAPKGWAQCNGQVMPVSQNRPLFSLIGNTYGGDGINTFALPNLQARTPISMGQGFPLASAAGEQAHVLTIGEVPTHTHAALGTSTGGDSPEPSGNYLGAADGMYGPLTNSTPLQPATIGNTGGSQPHNNMQPYLVLNFCIALVGVYPTQN